MFYLYWTKGKMIECIEELKVICKPKTRDNHFEKCVCVWERTNMYNATQLDRDRIHCIYNINGKIGIDQAKKALLYLLIYSSIAKC